MQYIISSRTITISKNRHFTSIYGNGTVIQVAEATTTEESRLKAIKLAMLLGIQESEKMLITAHNEK